MITRRFVAVFEENEIPELLTALAVTAGPYTRGTTAAKTWAMRQYNELIPAWEAYRKEEGSRASDI